MRPRVPGMFAMIDVLETTPASMAWQMPAVISAVSPKSSACRMRLGAVVISGAAIHYRVGGLWHRLCLRLAMPNALFVPTLRQRCRRPAVATCAKGARVCLRRSDVAPGSGSRGALPCR